MTCKKCGTSLEPNDRFCYACGAPVEPQAPTPVIPSIPSPPPAPTPAPDPVVTPHSNTSCNGNKCCYCCSANSNRNSSASSRKPITGNPCTVGGYCKTIEKKYDSGLSQYWRWLFDYHWDSLLFVLQQRLPFRCQGNVVWSRTAGCQRCSCQYVPL